MINFSKKARSSSLTALSVLFALFMVGGGRPAHAEDKNKYKIPPEAQGQIGQMGQTIKDKLHSKSGYDPSNDQTIDTATQNGQNTNGNTTSTTGTTGTTGTTSSGSSDDTDTTTSMSSQDHANSLSNTINDKWYSALQSMATQLTAGMVYQAFMVGTLLDAKLQAETQQVFQELTAAAHRDYQTDTTVCSIGTNVRSLAAAEAVVKVNTRALDLSMQKRDMLSGDQSASQGNAAETSQRWEQFKRVYCDPYDAGHNLATVCQPTTGRDSTRINRDINYTRTVEGAYTLNADFTTSGDSSDKEDVIALSRNLFAFHTFDRLPPKFLSNDFSHDIYQDLRSIEAIRSVARNSFAHIVGMRASGTPAANNVAPFMRAVVQQMGVPTAEIDKFLGPNPSYFAQMEVLTHKIYENPEFYANLYTTPANVGRIGVSVQALRLMQDRDRYEAALRREMLVSLLLELQVRGRQETTTGEFLRNSVGNLMNNLWQAAPAVPPLP